MTADDLRHIRNDHGANEEKRGQVNVTAETVSRIYDTVNDFDEASIQHSDKLGNKKMMVVRSRENDSVAILIERGKRKAEVKTFYEHEKKTSSVFDAHSPERNVRNDPKKSSSIPSVPQEEENGNGLPAPENSAKFSVDMRADIADNGDRESKAVFGKYLNDGIMQAVRDRVQQEIGEHVNLDDMADSVKRDAARDSLPYIKKMNTDFNTRMVQKNEPYKNRLAVKIEYARRCFDNDERIQHEAIRRMDGHDGQESLHRAGNAAFPERNDARGVGEASRQGSFGISRSIVGERQGAKAHFDKLYHDMAESRSDKQDGFSHALHSAAPESRAAVSRLAKGEGAKLRRMLAAAKFLKVGDLTAEERNLSALGEEMGTPVVWMDGDASLHGFHSGGVTFLNRRSEMRLPQVFWHESFHYMRANNPALYGEMVRHVERAEHITKEQMDAYREKIGRPSLSDADVIEEMLADRMQDVKERVRLLKDMGRENAGLAARIAAWLRRMIDRFVAHFSRAGDRLSERQTAAMAEAFSRVMHDMKDGEGKPLFRVRGKSVRMADGRELPALDAKEQTADEKLKADAKARKQTLKEAWEGNMPESQMLKVMETPLALQLAGAKPLPLYMRQSKLMKIRGKHPEMTKAVLSELPKHLADPMIVFKSATKPGRIVVGLSLLDADGINVVVPIELDAGKAHTEINVVLSTYGKGSTSHGVNYGWFSRNIHTGNTLYVNKKQVADLYQSAGLQLPMEGRRFNDLFGSSIKTDADLVKMRAANRSKYSASIQPPTPQKEGNENETNAIKYSASLNNEPAGSASRIRRVLDGVKNGTRPIGGVAVRDYRGTSSVTVGKGQEARFMRDRGLTAKDIVEREELDGGKVRLRYRMKGLGPLGQFHTPRFLARTNPKIKAIYDLGEKAMHTQERLRNQFNKPVHEFARLTKREEDLQEVTSVLLQGDAEGRSYTPQDLEAMGVSKRAAEAYLTARRALSHAYKLLNEARMQVRTRTAQVKKSELPGFKESHWIGEADVQSVQDLGDGNVLLTWRGRKTYDAKGKHVTGEALALMQKDGNIHVTDAKEHGENMFSVSYVERIKPITGREGYFPHFFHEFMVYEVTKGKDGKEAYATVGSARTLNAAARYVAMEEFKPQAISMYERWYGSFNADPGDIKGPRGQEARYIKHLIQDINGTPRQCQVSREHTLCVVTLRGRRCA